MMTIRSRVETGALAETELRWCDYDPDRLIRETEAMEAAGLNPRRVDVSPADMVRFEVTFSVDDGGDYNLVVVYPPRFSFFAPMFLTDDSFPKGKHLSPRKDLCLLHDSDSSWDRCTMTAASLIVERVPEVLRQHADPEKYQGPEDTVTQIDAYYDYEPHSQILTAATPALGKTDAGTLKLKVSISERERVFGVSLDRVVRGAVVDVSDQGGSFVDGYVMPEVITKRWLGTSGVKEMKVPWIRLDREPPIDIRGIEILLAGRIDGWNKKMRANSKDGVAIAAILYPVSVANGGREYTWLFFVVKNDRNAFKTGLRGRRNHSSPKPAYMSLIKCDHIDPCTLMARAPKLHPLSGKKVVLVGAGAIGSSLAMHLARAGVGEIGIIDPDTVSAGNCVRWSHGFSALGQFKSEFLAAEIMRNYPSVIAKAGKERFGRICKVPEGQRIDEQMTEDILAGADIVVDATTAESATDYLAQMSWHWGKPFIWCFGSPGGYGGLIGRAIPNSGCGCYSCFMRHYDDGTIAKPNDDPEDNHNTQPVGCFDPTFRGTGMDMDAVANTAAKMVVATLCRGEDGGHQDFEGNVAVVNLWDSEKNIPILPQWTMYPLAPHPDCKALHD